MNTTIPSQSRKSAVKFFSVLFLILSLYSTQADTNVFAVLTTADGISYTNAHVDHATPVYADIWYDGGIVHVALTNLPESLRKQHPYDADKAAQFLAAEKQKEQERRAAERAQALAEQQDIIARAKAAGWIYIVDCDEKEIPKCSAIIDGVTREIYLKNPPKGLTTAVQQFIIERAQDETDYIMGIMHQDRTAQWLARENVQKDYRQLIPRVRAFDTGKAYNGIPLWQFVAKNN
jgi:hypothetical protein